MNVLILHEHNEWAGMNGWPQRETSKVLCWSEKASVSLDIFASSVWQQETVYCRRSPKTDIVPMFVSKEKKKKKISITCYENCCKKSDFGLCDVEMEASRNGNSCFRTTAFSG